MITSTGNDFVICSDRREECERTLKALKNARVVERGINANFRYFVKGVYHDVSD